VAQRLVIVGGDAGGMAAVSQVRANNDAIEIVALEKGHWTSYSACGIPYVLSGEVDDIESLVARRPQEFRDRHGVDVRMRHEAAAINLDERTVEVRDHGHDRTYRLGFDHLLIATGAAAQRPAVEGCNLPFVHDVRTLDHAVALQPVSAASMGTNVVIVGGGYLGVELAEAMVHRGANVALVDRNLEVMKSLDPDLGAIVTKEMRHAGVNAITGAVVEAIEPGTVHTSSGPVSADLVLLAAGVKPNSALAEAAGLRLGAADAIWVDRRQRTSAEGVWSAGDCSASVHRVSGRPMWIALGTHANKQSRVAGINIGGGYATFPGVLGTAITRFGDLEISRTGLNQAEAAGAGFDATATTIEATTTAGYYPGAQPMTVRAVVERGSGRLLGAQIVGGAGAAKRIDTCAVAITAGMTVNDIVDLDLAYAPPFAGVWDPVLVAARAAMKVG